VRSFIAAHILIAGCFELKSQEINISVNRGFRYIPFFDASVFMKLSVDSRKSDDVIVPSVPKTGKARQVLMTDKEKRDWAYFLNGK